MNIKKAIYFFIIVTFGITCTALSDENNKTESVGNFNASDPSFVSYVRENKKVTEVQITNVVAYSEQTRKDTQASYASYTVDQSKSTKWQSVSVLKSDEVSITFGFDIDYPISSIKLFAQTYPKSLEIMYTSETDGVPKRITPKIIKDGSGKRRIDLNGITAKSITFIATGLANIYGGSSCGFEISEAEFFTFTNLPVKETIPAKALITANPFNRDTYKVSENESVTFKLNKRSMVYKIGIKSRKHPLGLDLYYTEDGEEKLLRQVSGLTGTTGEQFFEFDAIYTDTIIIKAHNECEIYSILIYEWDTDSSSWAATDGLGRSVSTYDDTGYSKRQNKQVGIFYFFAHSSDVKGVKHYDVTKILEENPSAMDNGRGLGADMMLHWWGEPAFGFYNQNDEWVLRKDAKMLSDAGVDFLIFDLTNFKAGNLSTSYKKEIITLCNVFTRVRAEGGKTPQFMFFMPPLAPNAIAAFDFWWENMYRDGLYEELWYKWDNGKPVALTFKNQIAGTRYVDFFEIRNAQSAITPFYTSQKDDWQWVSAHPQGIGYSDEYPIEAINASPAQNVSLNITEPDFQKYNSIGYHIGFSIGYNKETQTTITRGRDFRGSQSDFSGGAPAEIEDLEKAIYEGWNFKEQLDFVLEKDPRVTFITGWNEWTMYKIPGVPGLNGVTQPGGFFFWDAFNYRYTRDIQPLSYHYKDATYYQMVDFIRKYKGASPQKTSEALTISMDGFEDWLKVENAYYSDIGDITYRDAYAFNNKLKYTDYSGRNDIIMSKASYDSDNIYFYVKTKDDMTPYTDTSWMRLFIRTDGKGWEGYDYILNRNSPSETEATLEKFNIGSWTTTIVGNVDYVLKGREMQIKIPRSMLGLTGNVNFEFKWHDNMQKQGDALDFTISGDAAPSGRFNYVFRSKVSSKTSIHRVLIIAITSVVILSIGIFLLFRYKNKKKRV